MRDRGAAVEMTALTGWHRCSGVRDHIRVVITELADANMRRSRAYRRAATWQMMLERLCSVPYTSSYEDEAEDHGDAELSGSVEGPMAGHCPPCRFDRSGAGLR